MVPGDYVRITLSDTGHGMNADVVARAFDTSFTTKAVGEGNGLGLGQAYCFAKRSGGHAAIESIVDVGTSVALYLPLATADGNTAHSWRPRAILARSPGFSAG
jgi:signal transduction histidine kinase